METDRTDAGWATLPNLFTVLRFLLLVPVCWRILDPNPGPLAVVLLVLWAGTDWVDGWLARRTNQVSRVGEILDPIADRLGISAVVVCLALQQLVSWWVVALILVTDAATVLLAGHAAARGHIHVNWLGKVRTAVLFVALVLLVAASTWLPQFTNAGRSLLWAGAGMHALAGLGYVLEARGTRS